jgi:crotonobetainyl-CoA:carnitine CoA-transferase CaiB-like acyl-CoA transferase
LVNVCAPPAEETDGKAELAMTAQDARPAPAARPGLDVLPLGGIRVLDLSGPVGSYGGRLLADIGADVVKVELPDGDELRRQGPFAGRRAGPERSLTFAYYHANKRGVVVDYRRPEAGNILAGLGASADVVLVTPPVTGFDPDTGQLSWAAADAIVCAVTPFGLTGPYRSWRATHLTSCALGGVMYSQGWPDEAPVVMPGRQLYDHAGTHVAIAVLAALRERPAAGGQFIEVSAHESLGSYCFDLHRYTNFSDILRRRADHPGIGGMWPCADGMVELAVITPKHWAGLVELLGSPPELSDPALIDPSVRQERTDELRAVIGPAIAAMGREDMVSRAQQLSVPCSLVNTVGQFAGDPQPRSRNFFVRTPLAALGDFEVPGRPFLSGQPLLAQYRRPAPRLGEHDPAAIAREWQAAGRPAPGAYRPLSGIKVISFGMVIAGATCATALAELGADVIKIESPGVPDSTRRLRMADAAVHEPSGMDVSPMFANFNRSVRSLALDMKQPSSIDLVLRLAAGADVVIENYGPDVLDRWGIGYGKIASVNPRIVMLSQTGFGHTEGPRSHYLAYGATIFSFVGLAQIWGRSHGTHLDYPASAHGLFAILAALAARDRTGQGTHIDQAQIEVAGAIMGPMLLDYLVNGHEPGTDPPPGLVVRGLGDDAWLAVEPETDGDWARLAAAVGAADPGDRAAVTGALEAWASALTPQQATRMLQRAGLAAGAVQNNEDVTRDPQHRERHFLQEMDHPDLGLAEYAGPPYRLAKTPAVIRRRTPRLGEHTTEILAEWLGMPPEESQAYAWPPQAG